MRDRLRLNRLDDTQKPKPARDTFPFRGVLDRAVPLDPAPFHAWRPREDLGTIANAESALEHSQRQLDNLRALLGLNEPGDDPRAA